MNILIIRVEKITCIPSAANVIELTAVPTSESDPYPELIHFIITPEPQTIPTKNKNIPKRSPNSRE
jgi:hypothetical protein